MGLIDDIGAGPVALDTCVFIYLIEQNPTFRPVLEPLFRAIEEGSLGAITSTVSLLETLVVPYRHRNEALARRYEALFEGGRGLRLVEIDRTLLREAARLRAGHRMRTPDAIQLSAARLARCACFITNDRGLPEIPGIRVLELSRYV